MKKHSTKPSREDVLLAFAVEPDAGRATLESYLRDYPEFAMELVELSRERFRAAREDQEPLTAEDASKIDDAWKRHVEAGRKVVADPLAALTVEKLRALAAHLGVPRQIITAFRERRVDIASVPRRFLARFAKAIDSSVEALASALTIPAGQMLARSFKAAQKPSAAAPASFEQLLIEAGVSEERRAALMADDE